MGQNNREELGTLVVYCHPWEGSFNHAVLRAVCAGLERAGEPYEVADLHADGFDPVLRAPDLALYTKGGSTDPLVVRYQEQLLRSRRLVVVCPVWWNDVPAMLKGWIDKVMLVGFSWEATGAGLKGTLGRWVGRVDVFTTSAEPTEHLEAAIGSVLMDGTFAQLGIAERHWHNFGGMDQSTPDARAAWLAGVEEAMAGEASC